MVKHTKHKSIEYLIINIQNPNKLLDVLLTVFTSIKIIPASMFKDKKRPFTISLHKEPIYCCP